VIRFGIIPLLISCSSAEVSQLESAKELLERELAAKDAVAGNLARLRQYAAEEHLAEGAKEARSVEPLAVLGRLSAAASEIRFGSEKRDADTVAVTLHGSGDPSFAVHALFAVGAAVPTLSLHELTLGLSDWSGEGELVTPHQCCALADTSAVHEPEPGILCIGRCRELRSVIRDLRSRIAQKDHEIDLPAFLPLAEYEAAVARPDGIRAQNQLLAGVFAGQMPPLTRGRVQFRGEVSEVSGAMNRRNRGEDVVNRLRASFEVEKIETAGGFHGVFRRKPGSLARTPLRDAAASWNVAL
jgi:hypothetical protein